MGIGFQRLSRAQSFDKVLQHTRSYSSPEGGAQGEAPTVGLCLVNGQGRLHLQGSACHVKDFGVEVGGEEMNYNPDAELLFQILCVEARRGPRQ